MFAVRSAFLVLVLGVLAMPCAASASSSRSSSATDDVLKARQVDSSITSSVIVEFPDSSTISRRMRRKGHLKAALDETDHELEEADLGPVYVPDAHHSRRLVRIASPRILTTCRLRC